jgi:hypothetical protein
MYTNSQLTKHVASLCVLQQDKGNNHPNIRDIELDIIANLRDRSDDKAKEMLVQGDFYANLRPQIEDAFKKLRVYFLEYDVIVVPYNACWDVDKYPIPRTEFEARMYLTGPHYPIYGIYFVVDKNDKGDQMYMAYCNREDGKERNKREINHKRVYLGVEQDVLPASHVEKRDRLHSEKSIEQLTADMNALRRLIAARKKKKKEDEEDQGTP